MNTFELIEGHSAIGEFYVQLRSIRIVEKRTGKIVPKFIVWERIGRAVNHEYQMIVEQCHPDYEFYRFDDKSLIGRATI
jgi:predicted RecB family nuclease